MKTSHTYDISAHNVNSDGYLTMRNMAGMMFDTSIYQRDLAEKNLLLPKIHRICYDREIEIERPIKEHEKVRIETFATKMDRFKAYRNFIIRNDEKILVKAYCLFLVVNENLKITRLPQSMVAAYGKEEPVYFGRDNFSYTEDFEKEREIQIRKTDIDTNGHVNNAAYFDLLREAVDIKAQDISYLNIVYKKEIRGDKKSVKIGYKDFGKYVDFKIFDGDETYSLGKVERRNV